MSPPSWLWPLLIFMLALTAVLRSAWFKGWQGEVVIRLACKFLDPKQYHVIHNVTLPAPDSGTTQIDHVIISRFGIFALETKNYGGAIYGSEDDRTWTQAIGNKKIRFPNPLRQNYRHTRTLSSLLGIPHEKVKSIVVFAGSARLKTKNKLPENVLTHGLLSHIKSHREALLSQDEVERARKLIAETRLAPGLVTRRRHVRNVRAGHVNARLGARAKQRRP